MHDAICASTPIRTIRKNSRTRRSLALADIPHVQERVPDHNRAGRVIDCAKPDFVDLLRTYLPGSGSFQAQCQMRERCGSGRRLRVLCDRKHFCIGFARREREPVHYLIRSSLWVHLANEQLRIRGID